MLQEASSAAVPINWNAIGTILGVASALITVATIYLKMFIDSKITKMQSDIQGKMVEMQKEIMVTIESKFSQKELVALQISSHDRRIATIETTIEQIKKNKDRNNRDSTQN